MENDQHEVVPIPAHAPRMRVPGQQPPKKKMVPGTIGSMIIGMFAVVLCWFAFIPLGGVLFFIPSFIMGLVAYLRGRKYLRMAAEKPDLYSPAFSGFLRSARNTGLISVIVSCAGLLFGIIWVIASGGVDKAFR